MQYSMSDLQNGWMRNETLLQVCTFQLIERFRPHSSSVMAIALGNGHDSFPPGEAFGLRPRHFHGYVQIVLLTHI